MKKLCLLVLIVAAQAHAAPPSIEGEWEVTWTCELGPGCPVQEDNFRLKLQTHGDQVCAKLAATAYGGNRVDEDEDGGLPSVFGRYKEGMATVAYTSHWGGHGVAAIQVNGDSLRWTVRWHDEGLSYVPLDIVLRKVTDKNRPFWQQFNCPQ